MGLSAPPFFFGDNMAELRQYVRTRVLVDFDHFQTGLDAGVVLCTNEGILGLIRTLISTYGLRYANWVTSHTPGGYIGVSESQFDILDAEISSFLEETNNMAFCDDLTQAFNDLAFAFRAGCCGAGSFGAGEAEPPASTNQDDEEDFPPGFDTYAEYRAYKCDIANRIIQGIQTDIDWIEGGTLLTLTFSIFVATLLTPIPGDEILALVGFVVALLLQGVLVATAAAVSTEIDDSRQELVCLLYDALDAEQAKQDVTDFMTSALSSTQMALFASLWGFASVNSLFFKDVLLESSPLPGDVECTACGSECDLAIPTAGDETTNGIFTIVSPTVVTMTSGQAAAVHWGINDFNTNPVTPFVYCGPSVELDSYALSGFTPWATSAYRIYNSALTIVYNSSVPPDWSLFTDVRRIQLKSSTAFTGTITLV